MLVYAVPVVAGVVVAAASHRPDFGGPAGDANVVDDAGTRSAIAPVVEATPATPSSPVEMAAGSTDVTAGLRLAGIVGDGADPQLSFAIIEHEGSREVITRIGQTVRAGVVLSVVNADHVLLAADGRTYRLALVNSGSGRDAQSARLASASPEGGVDLYAPPVMAAKMHSVAPGVSASRMDGVAILNSSPRLESVIPSRGGNDLFEGGGKSVVTSGSALGWGGGAGVVSGLSSLASESLFTSEGGVHSAPPSFMPVNVAGLDAHTPSFMRGGEQEVAPAQVPEYMRDGSLQ